MNVIPMRAPSNSSVDAEQSLLGALIYKNSLLDDLHDVKPEFFSSPLNQQIWDEAVCAIRRGDIAEPISLAEKIGGGRDTLLFLADLMERAQPTMARPHADVVINHARMREVLSVVEEIRDNARTGTDAFDLIAFAEKTFSRMVQDAAPAATNMIDAQASAFASIDEMDSESVSGRAKGYMTGLRCFDRRLRGLRPGWLVVVAGRPSMGKTALARAAAFGAARKTKAQVVFFALEMARRELDERSLSQLSFEANDGIPYKDMSGETLSAEDRHKLRDLAHKVPKNLIIDDSPILSVDYVRRRVLAMKQRGPVAAVFIDYLQIMDRPDGKGRNEASVIGEMTKGLKQLAREAETCVVLLSQINRGVESRDDKRPQLSDLRESGAIEQDANAVLFPYREVYYLERSEPKTDGKRLDWENEVELKRRNMDVLCAKVRQGAVGTDHQLYFAEYDAIHDAPEPPRHA